MPHSEIRADKLSWIKMAFLKSVYFDALFCLVLWALAVVLSQEQLDDQRLSCQARELLV